jgi:lipoprotein NlpD
VAPAAQPGSKAASKTVSASAPALAQDPGKWLWPTEGRLLSSFKADDPSRNGIEIGGREGQPIKAAAPGEVVYSGNGLIGYGELIIVKHSDRMLSAYAHNRKRLVSEGQTVAAGELLAEMGRDERNQALLHFEVRVNGAPQDPMKYLPKR